MKYQQNYTQGVFVGMVCNANCNFCNAKVILEGYSKKEYFSFFSFEKIKQDVLFKVKKGAKVIIYEGGDFSLHPDIFKILEFGNSLGIKQTFQTNGIKLEDYNFVKKLKKYGIKELNFSIHAYKKELSDNIMGVEGAFEKTLKGVLNCNKLLIKTSCNFVLIKDNYDELIGMLFLILKLKIDLFNIIMYIPVNGKGDVYHKKFMLNPKIAGQKISKMLNIYEDLLKISKNTIKINFKFHNIARCIIEEKFHKLYFNFDSDRRKNKKDEYKEGTGFYKKNSCKKCFYDYNCPGFTEKYIDFFGDFYIKPILISNFIKNENMR